MHTASSVLKPKMNGFGEMLNETQADRRSWYLVFAKPRQENVAQENLQRQEYETFLPMVRVKRRLRGRWVSVIEPLFPRYLFIHLNVTTDNWSPIRSTVGVANIVRFGLHTAKLPDAFMQQLQADRDELGLQLLQYDEFQKGDRVRLVEGAMAGYEGIVRARTSKERVIMLLDIAGKNAVVHVSKHSLERAQ